MADALQLRRPLTTECNASPEAVIGICILNGPDNSLPIEEDMHNSHTMFHCSPWSHSPAQDRAKLSARLALGFIEHRLDLLNVFLRTAA